MNTQGYKQSRRAGSPRFGTKSDDYDYKKVTEYTLPPEELAKYQNGEMGGSKMVKFRKEEYLTFKDEGKSDSAIQKIWKIDHNKMQKLKKEWDLVGKLDRSNSKKQSAEEETPVKEEVMIEQIPEMPVTKIDDLEKENFRLMKIVDEESKKFGEMEERFEESNTLIENLKNKINLLDDHLKSKDESRDLLFNRIEELGKELLKKDELLKKQNKEAESEFETACHERDALITTLKIMARIS
jgi:chromosome segregation ATPase